MGTIKLKPPRLLSYQRAFLYNQARFTVVVACTKAGKTYPNIWWLNESALIRRNCQKPGIPANYWWVAPVYEQSKIAFKRAKTMLRQIFRDAPNQGQGIIWTAYESAPHRIEFPTVNSTITFRSAEKADNLYGEDVYCIVVDEATRIDDDSWLALQSVGTATRCIYKIIGNQTGRNWVTDKMALARSGNEPDTEAFTITYLDALAAGHPDFKQVEYERLRRTIPPKQFNALYMCELMDDEKNPFGNEAIRACATLGYAPQAGQLYFGVDLAKSSDYTVILGLTAQGEVAHFERFNKLDWPEISRRIVQSVGMNHCTMDATGVGSPIYDIVKQTCPNLMPFRYTPESKQELMTKLGMSIQQRLLRWHPVTHELLTIELESFESKVSSTGTVTYNARAGLHDDAVNALALADRTRQLHQNATFTTYF